MVIGLALAAASGIVGNTGIFLQKMALDSRRPSESVVSAFKKPWWVLGFVLLQLGWLAQIAALRSTPLYLVQPIASGGIVVLVVLARARLGEPIESRLVVGISLVVTGASFLALSSLQPTPISKTESSPLGAIAVLTLIALALGLWARVSKSLTAIGQAIAAGILYGVAVALSKPLAGQLSVLELASLVKVLAHKELYLVGIVSTIGLCFNQLALASGRASVVAPVVLATMTVLPVFFGVVVFGESLPPFPARAAVIAGGLACLLGVVCLARLEEEPTRDLSLVSKPKRATMGALLACDEKASTELSPTTERKVQAPSSTAYEN